MTISIHPSHMQAALDKLGQHAGTTPETPEQLASKFQSLMEKSPMAPPAQPATTGETVASKLAASQDSELQQVRNDFTSFSDQAPTMSMNEMMADTMRLELELSGTQLDLQAKMGVVDSSKSAVETLMKDQ
jgi:type III secretion inner rod protein HrpB2